MTFKMTAMHIQKPKIFILITLLLKINCIWKNMKTALFSINLNDYKNLKRYRITILNIYKIKSKL